MQTEEKRHRVAAARDRDEVLLPSGPRGQRGAQLVNQISQWLLRRSKREVAPGDEQCRRL